MSKPFKTRPKDNAKQIAKEAKRRIRLNSIKNELESDKISGFNQIFAIISETQMSIELEISFYAFRKKVEDPGEFTVNEMMRFASLIGVKYDVIATFILKLKMGKTKSKIF
ncbi:hypothetical protein Q4E93_22100 [Flavitalea sp. BT771]|uniref:hypothetical protein n=1 Tax=Flavitalea sp. BT771 TaxID=3063329 RepID=UPI0026E13C73|nr:hypothetical protein [Flavitalea sp. BT771]MDO6433320.1 hypothetical protein [Flavitalea sp. BT771]MDV6222775.1 hypothetical protein [Flavitalea sp. BT771]